MARGGYRLGAGRPKGAANHANKVLSDMLAEHMAAEGGEPEQHLAAIAEDGAVELEVRLAAARALFGFLAGRIVVIPSRGEPADLLE